MLLFCLWLLQTIQHHRLWPTSPMRCFCTEPQRCLEFTGKRSIAFNKQSPLFTLFIIILFISVSFNMVSCYIHMCVHVHVCVSAFVCIYMCVQVSSLSPFSSVSLSSPPLSLSLSDSYHTLFFPCKILFMDNVILDYYSFNLSQNRLFIEIF